MNRPIESEPVGRPAGERLSLKSRIIIAVGRRIGAFPSVGRDGQMSDRSVEIMDESIRRRMDEEMVAAFSRIVSGRRINIEAEAISLFNLVEAKEKERAVLENNFGKEKEKLEQEISGIKKQHEREDEEYQYQLKITRQQEQDETDFKNKVKERDFNEKLAVKQKELSLRESKVTEQEAEIKEMKSRLEKLPAELESVKSQTHIAARQEALAQAQAEKELLAKENEKH